MISGGMINWHAVLALGPQDRPELLTFQGRPIVYNPASAEDSEIMGPLLDRGLVWVGESIIGIRASEWARRDRHAGDAAPEPIDRRGEYLAEAEVRAEAAVKRAIDQRYDQRPLSWYAAARPLPADPFRALSLFQFEGRPILFADSHVREQEMLAQLQGGWTPIRWGYFPLALPGTQWDTLVRGGGVSWSRRREDG